MCFVLRRGEETAQAVTRSRPYLKIECPVDCRYRIAACWISWTNLCVFQNESSTQPKRDKSNPDSRANRLPGLVPKPIPIKFYHPKATMAIAATATATHPPLGPAFTTTPAAQPPPGQPDIAYHPDWDKYQARVARRTQTEDLPKNLPEGFPNELKGDLVWEGETLAQDYTWTYVFSAEQLEEIDNALAHFKCTYLVAPNSLVVIMFSTWLMTGPNSSRTGLRLHNTGDFPSSNATC